MEGRLFPQLNNVLLEIDTLLLWYCEPIFNFASSLPNNTITAFP